MTRRPNVLLVTLDQFRGDCLGVAGHPVVLTPSLDRLARDGVRFTAHHANCAPCGPARASLLTGLWQMNHRVTGNGAPLRDDLPMLPRLLRAAGLRPTLFGYTDTALDPSTLADEHDARRRNWEEAMPGFDVALMLDEQLEPWLAWLRDEGFDAPPGPTAVYEPAEVPLPTGRGATWRPTRYDADHSESAFVTNHVLDWLGHRAPGEPWCAHVSYLRPHPPYIAPAPYHDMFDPADVPTPVRHATRSAEAAAHPFVAAAMSVVPSPADELDQRQLQATYYGMIAEVDHQLGRVLDELDRRDDSNDTIVVVTADHGEQLGDHWMVQKLGFFRQSYEVPLIVRWPPLTAPVAGCTVDAPTESVDVLPTVLDLLGCEPPDFCDGASLRPLLHGAAESHLPAGWREAVHHEFDFRDPTSTAIERTFGLRQDQCCISVLRDGLGSYVQFAGGLPPLFFDLCDDPGELRDLAGDPSSSSRVLDYAQRLLRLRMEHTDPRLANVRATLGGTVQRRDPPRSTTDATH